MGSSPVGLVDPFGLKVTVVCRSVDDPLAPGQKHCSVFVWHWDKECKKIIDKQYSLAANNVPFSQGSPRPTYRMDTDAFNNPGGGNEHYDIPPPEGWTEAEFDQSVTNSGQFYGASDYRPFWGPNSNTATDNIIERAGGVMPDIPGAWRQNYGEPEECATCE